MGALVKSLSVSLLLEVDFHTFLLGRTKFMRSAKVFLDQNKALHRFLPW